MVISSDPPAAGVGNDSSSNGQAAGLKITNTAPLAEDFVRPSAASTTATTSEQPQQKQSHNDDHGVNPLDFQGAVESNNELPSIETLRKIENYVVLDRDGKTHPFKSLYTGKHVARRVLIIFVRHFFCGVSFRHQAYHIFFPNIYQNCQEYLRTVSAAITPDSLIRLPISTFIAVVGCGDPALIDMYAQATGCPFPVYADPTRKLYSELGMVRTLALGERPAYMKKSLFKSSLESIVQGLKQIPKGLATKSGDQRQIGGEFLFEPLSVFTPISSPWTEGTGDEKRLGAADGSSTAQTDGGVPTSLPSTGGTGPGHSIDGFFGSDAVSNSKEDADPRRVTWCHRMKTTRDHAEIPELMEVLGLDPVDASKPPRVEEDKHHKESNKRWSRALEMRKGSGLSMAGQMNTMKAEAAIAAPAPGAL